jgi:hypothetical protein
VAALVAFSNAIVSACRAVLLQAFREAGGQRQVPVSGLSVNAHVWQQDDVQELSAIDEGQGNYRIDWTPRGCTSCEVHVTLNGVDVIGSPLKLPVDFYVETEWF